MKKNLLIIISIITIPFIMLFIHLSKKTNLPNKTKETPKIVQESPYKKYGYNINVGLSKYKNALKKTNTQKVTIYCIGESNMRGEYSSDEVNKSWVGIMKSSLQNQYGNAGEGFINIYEGALPPGTKPRWTLGQNWSVSGALNTITSNVGGFGGCLGVSPKNATPATLAFTGTNLDLLYSKSPIGGTAEVTIDGTKVGTINCLGEILSFSHKISYSNLNNTNHTLVVTPTTKSKIYIEGAIASSNTTGIEVDKIAISSKGANYFSNDFTKKIWDLAPAPDLVLISFGLNESGSHVPVENYKTNITTLVTYWQGRGSNVCLVTNQKPADSWTTNWPAYINALYEISNTYNIGLIDIYKAYFEDYTEAQKQGLFGMKINDYSGGSGTNTAHPSDKGYKYIGDIIYENLK
ncbi:SGNH/GDSL hydrolase family protein [Clostridium sp. P21]|uniref:SGNH/GDSL hydrolase family protein n=1 Tax=Clostridium muellerianum TaxID=2716538 RepID=A0A7Y0EFB9_9CLOT|nr:SGNH/GDSL hydrolase family protein [Clostridium muellerianum]NMM62479.1 SGNH/GDSL hydrolase family protein [Clostridium muellerianum]